MFRPSPTYKTNLLITAPKIDTDFLWDMATLFVILAVIYMIGMFFYNYRISAMTKKVAHRKRELSPMVSEFLFLEDDATKDEKSNYIALKIEIRELLKERFNRRVLAEILLDLRRDVSGEAQQSLFQLYQDLGLHKDAFAKLKSWRWHVISQGILELTQMEVEESYGFVTKFINDKRSTIRKQAEIATVTLRREGINYFLDTTRYKISEWQQLKLLDVLRNQKDFNPPRFKSWLTSNNKYVVLFALRLLKFYNQNDASDSLIALIKHKNNQIKEEAIACIKEFNITAALDTLKLVFWNSSVEIKIAILGAIGEIGAVEDIEFLQLIEKKELNFSVKSKAISSINAIAPETIMPSKGIQDESQYGVPDDLSPKVVEKYAEKHEDVYGDYEDVLQNDLLEGADSPDEPILKSDTVDATVSKGTVSGKHAEQDAEFNEKAENTDQEKENQMDASNEKEARVGQDAVSLLQMEVVAEEVYGGDGKTFHENETIEWDEDHLHFLPIVTETAETGMSTTEPSVESADALQEDPVFGIQVVYEECLPDLDTPPIEKTAFFEEFDMAELAFLPLVVDNEAEPQDGTHETIKENREKDGITAIEVYYESVSAAIGDINVVQEPHETDSGVPMESVAKPTDRAGLLLEDTITSSYNRYSTPEIKKMEVVFEMESENALKNEVWDLLVVDPTEVTVETFDTNKETHHGHTKEDGAPGPDANDRVLQDILDDLFVSRDLSTGTEKEPTAPMANPDWDLDENELEFIPVSFEKEEGEMPSYIRIEADIEELSEAEPSIPKATIPKAIFGDIEFEASTRQLLNDLEEMGDEREIPYLKELLTHGKYSMFKDRINELIDLFNHSSDSTEEQVDHALQPFSVFQDLFRTCDTEAKLILLNEVTAVGDEKDIHFLENLQEDESPEIRKKAIAVLNELKKKLDAKKEASHSEDVPTDEFPTVIDFDELMNIEGRPSNETQDMSDLNFDVTKGLEDPDVQKKKSWR